MTEEQNIQEKPQKKKMSKLRKIGLAVIIVLLVFSLTFEFFGNKAIKVAIETVGSNTLNVSVTLDKIALSPLAGSVKIDNLVVANPEGYENLTLLELGEAKINLQTTSLLSKIVNVQEIKLDGMIFTIEQKGITNNLKEILDSLEKKEPATEEKPEKKKTGKKLHIDTLEITNVTVKAKLLPIPGKSDTVSFPLPTIKMTDIGGKDKEPVDLAELVKIIMDSISKAIAEHGTEFLPDDITGSIKNVLGNAPEQLKELGEKTLDKTKDIGKDVTEGLKGLFKKKD
jgi:hypothetical protein